MRIYTGLALALLLLIGGGYFFFLSAGSDSDVVDLRHKAEVTIELTEGGFSPADIRIKSGTKVIFTTTRQNRFWPASNTHPAHTLYPEFDPKVPIEPADSWSFVFSRPGAWGFHDHIRSYYTGVIHVD